jgi:hypothetical protein
VKDLRFVGHLDLKAANDLSVRLRKSVEAMTEQHLVGFDPHEVFTIGNEHHQKHDPVRGQAMYLCVVVLEEISNELVDGHPESTVKEVDKDYNLARIRGRHILAKGTPVTQKLPWHQKSPTTRFLMSSSIAVNTSHGELGTRLHPPLLFKLISSSFTELMVLFFLVRVFLGTMTATAGSGI